MHIYMKLVIISHAIGQNFRDMHIARHNVSNTSIKFITHRGDA